MVAAAAAAAEAPGRKRPYRSRYICSSKDLSNYEWWLVRFEDWKKLTCKVLPIRTVRVGVEIRMEAGML